MCAQVCVRVSVFTAYSIHIYTYICTVHIQFVYYTVSECVCVCVTQSALGWEHQTELSKHGSQTDAVKGFGGKFGVQKGSRDKVWSLSLTHIQ